VGNINGTGNAVANTINGNSGNNTLRGLGGDDNMHGGDGNDLLDGGTNGVAGDHMGGGNGNDVFIVDSVNDFVHEENGVVGGVDRIDSSVTLTLTDVDVENLTLMGTAAISGTGNSLDNVMKIDAAAPLAADTLIGAGGNDTLTGNSAANLLSGSNAPLARIAEDVGYQTDTAFSRAFRREYGTPPAAWRRNRSARPVVH